MEDLSEVGLLIKLEAAQLLCHERGLLQSSKWIAELACSMKESIYEEADKSRSSQETNSNAFDALSGIEHAKFQFARSLFECKEYKRCAFVLKQCKSPKCCFLAFYARFLNIEKQKWQSNCETISESASRKDKNSSTNAEIQFLEQDIEQQIKLFPRDPFMHYLLGAVQKHRRLDQIPAIRSFITAVNIFPFLWSAWVDLFESLGNIEQFTLIQKELPSHIMTEFFKVLSSQELHQSDVQIMNLIAELSKTFPESLWLKSQEAGFVYNAREYEDAEELYSEILKKDPTRIEDLDIYSNILFVQEDKAMLAYIAEVAVQIEQFRPETCIILGNYYSLASEHEKAITYFRRALQLNHNYLAAWTLLGHEYVELKNTHAAIEAYRRALNLNRKDYRAWYGLGQTYEVLEMHNYALYYYQRATALRPYDQRMWTALGNCYEILDQPKEAIKALQRAVTGEVSDPFVFLKIAQIYEKLSKLKEAAFWFVRCIKEEYDEEITSASSKARLWVAKEEIKRRNYKLAEATVLPVLDSYYDVEEAKAILRQIRSQQEA